MFSIYSDTTVEGYSAQAENDLRVLRQIEKRAQGLQMQMWRLEERWDKRRISLEKHTKGYVTYNFHDMLC